MHEADMFKLNVLGDVDLLGHSLPEELEYFAACPGFDPVDLSAIGYATFTENPAVWTAQHARLMNEVTVKAVPDATMDFSSCMWPPWVPWRAEASWIMRHMLYFWTVDRVVRRRRPSWEVVIITRDLDMAVYKVTVPEQQSHHDTVMRYAPLIPNDVAVSILELGAMHRRRERDWLTID